MPRQFLTTICGHAGSDVKLFTYGDNKQGARLNIGVSQGTKDKPKDTTWANVTVFGYCVEQCRNIKKGDAVYIEAGPAELNEHEGKSYIQYVAFKVYRIDWVKREQASQPAPLSAPPQPAQPDDPDLPF